MTAPVMIKSSVSGTATGPFEPLRDILPRFAGAHGGGALAVVHHGELVVDLAYGDYSTDDRQLQFSVSKAVTAFTAAHAADDGLFDLDRPLGDFWPEFAKPSTRVITTRMVLTHRSGLPGVSSQLTIDQILDGGYEEALERQEPYWTPGTTFGYHAFSFGPLLDGIFRRALGTSVGEYFTRGIARPLGLDMSFGDTDGERVRPYVRPVQVTTPPAHTVGNTRNFTDQGSAVLGADYSLFNDPRVIASSWPNSNVISSARDMAKLFAATLGSATCDRFLSEATVSALTACTGRGQDWVLHIPIAYGTGIQLPFPQLPYTGPRAYGHEGAGGCVAFADPDLDIAVAYTTNVYPPRDGTSPVALALLPTIRMLLNEER